MDKNNMNIDELVRQKLSGALEKEYAGSWLAMSDLLDREMPVEKNKRRRALLPWRSFLGVLSLIGVVGLGGFAVSQYKSDKLFSPTAGSNITQSVVVQLQKSYADNPLNNTLIAQNLHNESVQTNDKINSNSIDYNNHLNDNTKSKPLAFESDKNSKTKNNNSNSAVNIDNESGLVKQQIRKPQALAGIDVLEASNNSESQRKIAQKPFAKLNEETSEQNTKERNQKPQPELKTKSADLGWFKKDTITQIVAKEYFVLDNSTKNPVLKIDTISIQKVERNLWVAHLTNENKSDKILTNNNVGGLSKENIKSGSVASVAKSANSKSDKIIPGSAATELSNDPVLNNPEQMVALSTKKVESKKYYVSGYQNSEIKNSIDRAKQAVVNMTFKPGITFGANTFFTKAGMVSGFQAGLTGLLTFSKNMSLLVELKYLQNFNNGQRVVDNYVSGSKLDSGTYWNGTSTSKYYEIRKDSLAKGFKFNMIQHVSLPIMLRYSIGRFDILGGATVNYFFPIKVEDAGQQFVIVNRDSTATSMPYSVVKQNPSVGIDDFNARFGLGYVFGLSYQFTPAVNLDLRMSKVFSDNAKSPGAKTVSNQLIKVPSVQISMGYRFGQRNQSK